MRLLALVLVVFSGSCASGPPPSSGLSAGVCRIKITPEKMSWMTGYGNRNKRAEKVHDDLYVRALALDDGKRTIVLVAADILGFPPVMNRAIRAEALKRHGLEDGDLMLVASHTHGGPSIPQRPSLEIFHGLGDDDTKEIYAYADRLQGQVLEAIGKALGERAPATLTRSRGQASFGINRRLRQPNGSYRISDNPEGAKDPDVPVIRVESEGKTKATVFTYACHCTTLGGVYEYNADWAGVAAAKIEEKTGGVALFATGCGADLNPSPRGSFELAEKHGIAMAEAVAAAKDAKPLGGPFRTAYETVDLPLEKPPSKELLKKGLADKNVYRQRHSKEMLKLEEAGKMPSSVALPIQAWHFGEDLTMIAIGGETCVEYALRLKHELGPGRTVVVGYANEVPCYIPSEKVLAEGGYEAGWDLEHGKALAAGSMTYYGWPVPFAPGVEDRLIQAVHALVKKR